MSLKSSNSYTCGGSNLKTRVLRKDFLALAAALQLVVQAGGGLSAMSAAAQGITPQPMPKQFLDLYYQGITYMKKGEIDKALQIFKQVAINAPYDPLVHLSLAEAMHQSGDTENSIAEYRRAIRIRPYDAFARMTLGSLLQAQGELQEAVNEYDEAIKLRPDVVLFRLNLGVILRIAGNTDEAINELKKVVQAYPEHLKARSQLAAAFQDKGEYQQAIENYSKILRSQPQNFTTWQDRFDLVEGFFDIAGIGSRRLQA